MKQNITRKEMRTALAWMQKVQRKAAFRPGIDVSVDYQCTKENEGRGKNSEYSVELRVYYDVEDGGLKCEFFTCAGYLDADAWKNEKDKATEFLEKFGVNVK